MNVVTLLNQLAQKDIRLWLDQEQLRYSAPDGAMTADVIQQLKAHKAQIIEFLQQAGSQQSSFPLADTTKNLVVSSAQQRFWLLQQLDPDSSAFHIHTALEIKGNLDITALEQACLAVIERQSILRTRYYQQQGKLYQAIDATTTWRLEQESTAIDQLHLAIQREKNKPFDLSQTPLFRCKLFTVSKQHYVLSFTVHHIAADGWSLGIFVQELVHNYQTLMQQQTLSTAQLERQYIDFAYWQQSAEQQQKLQQQLDDWTEQLQGVPHLDLPTKTVRQANTASTAAHYSWQISTAAFNQLNQRYQGTLFTTSLAVLSILLQRYCDQNDFCIGTPVAGRSAASALESIIGCFINVLAIRCEFDEEQTVNQYIKNITQTCEQALSRQDVPFEQIIQKLQLKPDLSTSPIFQVMLAIQNAPFDFQPLPDLHISQYLDTETQAQYDLTLFAQENDDHIRFTFEYKTALFDHAFIQRMAKHFDYLVEEIAHKPDVSLNTLAISTQQHSDKLIGDIKEAQLLATLPERFSEHAKQRANHTAITFQNQHISYQELAQQSDILAQHLLNSGVKAGDFVGICLHREPRLLASILAILRVGAAYVPLDPTLPTARLDYIVQDSQATLSICNAQTSSLLAAEHNQLCLDNLDHLQQQTLNTVQIKPNDLAYLLYTSGSTGNPKGVMIGHIGLANYLDYAADHYLSQTVGAVVSSSISFDATITSLLAPLYAGKTVFLTSSEDEEFDELAQYIFQNEQSLVFKITPAHLDFLFHKHSHQQTEKSHIFVIGGEQLLVSQAQRWLNALTPQATWVNEYGPTETVVGCSTFFFNRHDLASLPHGAVPIGKPIQNTELFTLDQAGRNVPLGIPGELCIASLGVARGYLNLAEQTQQSFLAHTDSTFSRLYRTGDKVRLLDNGDLLYLGRSDHQVKIRGQRLELSEIETALLGFADIKTAVVDIREHHGDKRLVAWYQSEISLEHSDLKQQLSKILPAYMLPSQFVALQHWPLTSNGKVNRNKLPDPDWQNVNQQDYIAPSSSTEIKLAAIWQQVLQLERIGIHDNFFEIGGHSLTAAEALSLAQHDFAVQIPLRQLFDNPSIAAIAKHIDDALIAQTILANDEMSLDEETESFVL